MEVAPGEFLGIVGPSGVGKATIFDLMLKFYQPQKGQILLGGVDISQISASNIRKNITLVSQDTFLFAGTLRDNLLAIKPEATESELLKALELAGFVSVLNKLSDGLETEIGENGVKLSSGEKQRLALARGILLSSKILLLDEVTSDLVIDSQEAIKQTVSSLAK